MTQVCHAISADLKVVVTIAEPTAKSESEVLRLDARKDRLIINLNPMKGDRGYEVQPKHEKDLQVSFEHKLMPGQRRGYGLLQLKVSCTSSLGSS